LLSPNFTPFPVLETERLILRQLTAADAQRMYEIRSNPSVMHFVPRPLAQSAAEMVGWIADINKAGEENKSILWGITLKGDDRVHGMICIKDLQLENDRGELGYMLDEPMHRRGIMRESIGAVMDYGFKVLKLHSMEAIIDPLNTASLGLIQQCGFVKEAHFRENFFYKGEYLDTTIWTSWDPAH
jgi:ribosomal-protein-alanine N-acetyltransferase